MAEWKRYTRTLPLKPNILKHLRSANATCRFPTHLLVEAQLVCDELETQNVWCQSLRKDIEENPHQKNWREMEEMHNGFLKLADDLLKLLWDPRFSPSSDERLKVPIMVWLLGIKPCMDLLRFHPNALEFSESFFYDSYHTLTMYTETYTDANAWWYKCLGELCTYRIEMVINGAEKRQWFQIQNEWRSKCS